MTCSSSIFLTCEVAWQALIAIYTTSWGTTFFLPFAHLMLLLFIILLCPPPEVMKNLFLWFEWWTFFWHIASYDWNIVPGGYYLVGGNTRNKKWSKKSRGFLFDIFETGSKPYLGMIPYLNQSWPDITNISQRTLPYNHQNIENISTISRFLDSDLYIIISHHPSLF